MTAPPRIDIVRRKAVIMETGESPRKKMVDFLKVSGIITDNFTGSLELIFNQGGIVGSRRIEKDPI